MSTGLPVAGFCYATLRELVLTPAEWRRTYPASKYRRRVENGDTFYTPLEPNGARLVAEAYAIIPK